MATEEITITELELAEEVLGDMVIAVDSSNDTKSVNLKQLRAWLGSNLPTGFILPAVGKINDERFTLLDGKTLSKTGTYSGFCAKVEEQVQEGNWLSCTEEEYNADVLAYNQCGKFVIGVDYVRIPKITKFIGATITLSEMGKTYAESLPNITGHSCLKQNDNDGTPTGAYKRGNANAYTGYSSASGHFIDFDASLSSSTYQDGAKVQPDHTKYPYYMVVSTEGQTSQVNIDVNQIYEDMNLKANKDLSNVSDVSKVFKNVSTGWGMPDYEAGVAFSSGFTCPENGFIFVGGSSQGWSTVNVNNIQLIYEGAGGTYFGYSGNCPVSEGDVVTLGGSWNSATFYPLKGVN